MTEKPIYPPQATVRQQSARNADARSAALQALAHRMTDNPELPFCVPGLAAVISRPDQAGGWDRAFVGTDGAGVPIQEDTLFPLASASKLAMGSRYCTWSIADSSPSTTRSGGTCLPPLPRGTESRCDHSSATPAGSHSTSTPHLEPRPEIVRSATIEEARRDQTGGELQGGFGTTDALLGFRRSGAITWPGCVWGLAVELRGDKRPHWSPATATGISFGHIGASGCIAWCDPERAIAWAALAPRTTDYGWLLRHGPALGSIALRQAEGTP